MIGTIGGLVQTLVVLVIVTTLLDMLLPQNNFRQYLRLVVGMLVLLMIVNVLANLLGRGEHYLGELMLPLDGEMENVSREGEEMWQTNQQAIISEYRGRLKKFLAEELQAEGWQLQQLQITLEEDINSKDFGKIKGVLAVVNHLKEEGGDRVDRVEVPPVRVEGEDDAPATGEEGKPMPELESVVASRLGIPEKKVEVLSEK